MTGDDYPNGRHGRAEPVRVGDGHLEDGALGTDFRGDAPRRQDLRPGRAGAGDVGDGDDRRNRHRGDDERRPCPVQRAGDAAHLAPPSPAQRGLVGFLGGRTCSDDKPNGPATTAYIVPGLFRVLVPH